MMEKKTPIILPEKYYLDYFHYLLDFVEKHNQHILDQTEYEFYQEFRQLSEEARCLYIRFLNRKGDFFRFSRIAYQEIKDKHAAKEELYQQGFITINESKDVIQHRLFTKKELSAIFPFLDTSAHKESMLLELDEVDVESLHKAEEIVQTLRNDEVDFIKLLFFGHYDGMMTDFVVRDVGNVKIQPLKESQFKPWYGSRDEALSVFHIYKVKKLIRLALVEEMDVKEMVTVLPWEHWLSFPKSKKVGEKLLLEIAYHFERLKDHKTALMLYDYITAHPARERKVRLLTSIGKVEEADSIAREILTSSLNATEYVFAKDYLEKTGIRINRSMTKKLKEAEEITIPKPEIGVEQAVLNHLTEWEGMHAENHIWRALFGLTFWDVIFNEAHGSFHQPLQRQPSDLEDAAFFEKREGLLKARLLDIKSRKVWIASLAETIEAKYGVANRYVSWHEELLELMELVMHYLPLKGLKETLLQIARNPKENSRGFPDLFLWKEDEYQFYEVKSPNDHLSAQQLFWIDFLNQQKINVKILRVNYQP